MPALVDRPPQPPSTQDPALQSYFHALYRWLDRQWRKTGGFSFDAPINSENITGILASANAGAGLVKNVTNDATIDSIDAGSTATVRVYGPGGVGSNWNRYRNKVLIGTHAAVQFTGRVFSTFQYAGFDVVTGLWTISLQFKDVTGDNMVMFSVKTVDDGGAGGTSGGGGSGSGGSGGVGGGGGGGFGVLL